MRKVSQNELSELTQKDRKTVRYLLANLRPIPGPHGAKLYPSNLALETIYLGQDGAVTNAEAVRQLNIAKKREIDLGIQIKEGGMVSAEQYRHDFAHLIAVFRANLLSRMGEVVDNAFLDGCQKELQDFLISTEPEESARTAMRRALCERAIEEADAHIKYLKAHVARDTWRADFDEASERVRQAYSASVGDKSQAAVDRLESARAACELVINRQPPM